MTKIEAPEPGIYNDIDFDEYRTWNACNNSSFGALRKSPAHYWHEQNSTEEREETDAFRFGTFVHAGQLEPVTIAQHYIVRPDLTGGILRDDGTPYKNVRASKEYKERVVAFEAMHTDKQIVSQDEFNALMGIIESIADNNLACAWLRDNKGQAEVSIVWDDPETGIRCKARIDRVVASLSVLADIKTTIDANPFEFRRTLYKRGYARAAAFYTDGWEILTGNRFEFGIVAVEKTGIFGCCAATIGPESIKAGRREYQKALRAIAAGRETGHWPAYENPEHFEMYGYDLNRDSEVELIIDGNTVQV